VNYDDTDLVCHGAPSSRHRSATYVSFHKRRTRHQAIRALEFTFAAARYPSFWNTAEEIKTNTDGEICISPNRTRSRNMDFCCSLAWVSGVGSEFPARAAGLAWLGDVVSLPVGWQGGQADEGVEVEVF
jgi:hypothetical protein